MEIEVRHEGYDDVIRVSDVRLVREVLDNPYLLVWSLKGKVGDEWEHIAMAMPDKEEKILKWLKVFREADYYWRCTREVPVVQVNRGREIVLEEKVERFVKEKNLWDKYWRG